MTGIGIATGGVFPVLGLAAAGIALFLLASWRGIWPLWLAGYVLTALALAAAFFFRDPVRAGERGPLLYVAPADGRVVAVERVEEPRYLRGEATRVAIYLSLLDVHVQRSPVDGVVELVGHRPGRFAPAWSERSAENEATDIGIDTGQGRVLVRQMAGTVARRIVTYVEEGARVEQGKRIGLIRFGSRVELYLPTAAVVLVAPGDRVRAGASVIARAPEAP